MAVHLFMGVLRTVEEGLSFGTGYNKMTNQSLRLLA